MTSRSQKRKNRRSRQQPKPVVSRGDEGGSIEAVARQLDTAHDTITRLRAERNAWAVRAGAELRLGRPVNYPGDIKTQTLLERVAAALLLADLVANARQAMDVSSGPGRLSAGSTTSPPEPGKATARQRDATRTLKAALRTACSTWEYQVDNRFHPPKKDDVPRVSCQVKGCPSEGLEVVAWRTIRGGRTVYHERCSSCGTPFNPVEVKTPTAV